MISSCDEKEAGRPDGSLISIRLRNRKLIRLAEGDIIGWQSRPALLAIRPVAIAIEYSGRAERGLGSAWPSCFPGNRFILYPGQRNEPAKEMAERAPHRRATNDPSKEREVSNNSFVLPFGEQRPATDLRSRCDLFPDGDRQAVD